MNLYILRGQNNILNDIFEAVDSDSFHILE